jgi:hypothetical protein
MLLLGNVSLGGKLLDLQKGMGIGSFMFIFAVLGGRGSGATSEKRDSRVIVLLLGFDQLGSG